MTSRTLSETAPVAVASELLTEAQAGLWYAQRLDPANPVFNTAQYVDLRGPLDLDRFRAAIDQAMGEADALAVRIIETDDGPAMVRDDTRRAAAMVVDCRHDADPEASAIAAMRRDLNTPLDLSRDPVAAQIIFVIAADRHFWYQRVHHVAIDGYGTGLLTRRIADLYRSAVTATAPATRPFAGYERVIAEDRLYGASAAREADRGYWMAAFADRPPVIGMAEGTPLTAHAYHSCEAVFPPEAIDAVRALAARSGVNWPDAVTTLVGTYIQRHIGGNEAVIGVPAMLRVGQASARVPAMVMNVLPVRMAVDESQPLEAVLRTAADRMREARKHGRYRSEQLRRDLGLLSDQRRLYGVLVNVLPFDGIPAMPELSASMHVLCTGPVDDLTVTVRADADANGLRLELDGNPTLYSLEVLRAHAMRLATFIERGARAATLAEVPTLTDAEHQRWVVDVNATSAEVENVTLTTIIERSMRVHADRAALTFAGVTLSYAELDRRTAVWAGRLAAAGVTRGDVVAVALPRSLELEIALVAVLRAGAAYLPIDLDYPDARVRTMFEIARPKVLLTSSLVVREWPKGPIGLHVDQPIDSSPRVEIDLPQPDDPAYVIFTSGSTGAPKGAVIQHRAIVNRLEWMRRHYGFGPDDRILQKTPATFDVSVWEFFLPLISGATLVMAPPDAHRDPAWLAQLIREHSITTLHFVPSMLAQFVAEPSARGLSMTRVFCSGEALSAALRDQFHATIDAELHNLYGPTEAAVDVTYWDASRHDRSTVVPIGFPVWNTRMYVLDGARRPVPPGAPGDLYIAGIQLAREYLGRPDLTAERFVADPFGKPGDRMYLTGDVARWRDDGAIEYLGRSDFQVKLRGQRIELGEIETVLRAHSGVADAAVVMREDRPGDQRLVAYVVTRDTVATDVGDLTAMLQQRVPSFMVPSAIVMLAEMPLNASGKLDRRRLPAPAVDVPLATGRPPATPTGERLAHLYRTVLDVDGPIGGASDFFALGGQSLLAVQLARKIRETWNCELSLGAVFAHPTVDALAAAIDRAASRTTDSALAEEGLGVLLPLGHRGGAVNLFCVHPAGGMAWCYDGLARSLPQTVTTFGLQARALDPAEPLPDSLLEIARDYVREIRRVQPAGPYHLAGWSVGGILAHAMTEVIEEQGERVRTLAVLDAYPCDRWRHSAPPNESIALRALLLMAGLDPDHDVAAPLTRERVVAALRASGHALGTLSDTAISGVIRVVERNSALVRAHRHRLVDATMLYFRAALDHAGLDLSPREWLPYVDNLIIHDVPALHAQMTGADAIRIITPQLVRWMSA